MAIEEPWHVRMEREDREREERREKEQREREEKMVRNLKFAAAGLMALVVLAFASCAAHTVGPGERGIKVTLGNMEATSLVPGLYFVNPFVTHIHDMNVQIAKLDDKTAVYTRDVQTATVHYVLTYSLEPEKAYLVYQQVGEDWDTKLVGPVVNEQVKRVLGQYDAVDLIAKRNDAARLIESDITTTLKQRHVLVNGLQLTNIDYTPAFEKAVEAKVVAQQKAIEEQNRTVQIEQQAKQTVISATAEANSMQIRAHALESNPKLVEWEAVQKWDGHMPQYMMGGAVPFINLQPGR